MKSTTHILLLSIFVGTWGNSEHEKGRIVGGQNANRREAPWQIGLTNSATLLPIDYYCGGVLIDPLWVLTAAHCVEDEAAARVISVAGDYDRTVRETGEQAQPGRELHIHPLWASSNKRHGDIALIKLDRPFTINADVKTIQMLENLWRPPSKAQAIVTGWGLSRENPDQSPNILQKLTVLSVPYTECLQYGLDTLCMVRSPNNMGEYVGICDGDSGGPLVINHNSVVALVGIVAGKSPIELPCGDVRNIEIYTEIYRYKDWMCDKIGWVC